jgi:hypothetical protein
MEAARKEALRAALSIVDRTRDALLDNVAAVAADSYKVPFLLCVFFSNGIGFLILF